MAQFVWPNGSATAEPRQTSPYGYRGNIGIPGTRPFHVGDDTVGFSEIRSIGAGTVIESGWIPWAGWQVLVYYGEIGGVRTWVRYCHMAHQSYLKRGDGVGVAQLIGTMGTTGISGGVHLHWEMYRGSVDRGVWADPGTTIDPRPFVRALINNNTNSPTTSSEEEDEPMKAVYYQEGKNYNVLVFHPVSGFTHEYVTTDPAYNNIIATTFGTGSFAKVSKSHYNKLKADLAKVLKEG